MNQQEERLINVTEGLESNPKERILSEESLPDTLSESERKALLQMALIEGHWEHTHELPEDKMDISKPYDFNTKEVGETFVTNIVNRQVPGYKEMRRSNVSLTKQIVLERYAENPNKEIVIFDSGCSNGAAIFDLISALSHSFGKPGEVHPAVSNIRYIGIDNAPAMVERANQTLEDFRVIFDKLGTRLNGHFEFKEMDAMDTQGEYSNLEADISISTLVAMFIPVHHRSDYFDGLAAATKKNGHLLLTEKTLANNSENNTIFGKLYHKDKFRNGLSLQAIRNKHLSLPRFLHPVQSNWTEEWLKSSGFVDRQLFWKHYFFESSISRRA